MSPKEAMKWLDENMKKEFPVGVFVDKVGDEK
jgi:2-oxoglutarate ferredoxin oxidoreductase subunit beta